MKYISVALLSAVSAAVLFVLTKIIGNKQISEMNMFDYIVGITIGSIGAEMATGIEENPWYALIAMAVYALLAFLISIISNKSIRLRRILSGSALVLMDKGEIYKDNLKTARMDVNEFLSQCRLNGYFNPDEIETALLEPNGRISILPKAEQHPTTPKDMGIKVNKSEIMQNVVIDGKILTKNLRESKQSEEWLRSQLKAKGFENLNSVLLAVCDTNGKLLVYPNRTAAPKGDPFQ